MKGRLVNYHEGLIKSYKKDKGFSFYYLAHKLNDGDPQRFLNVLKDVLTAHVGSASAIAKKTKLSTKEVEQILSDESKSEIHNFIKILGTLGLQFATHVQQPKKAKKTVVATKAKKKTVVRSRKKVIVPVIKIPSAQISKLARKSTQSSLKIRRAQKPKK